MSIYHETYRRCASVALVLAVVLIALPSMLNAQTAPPNAPSVQSADNYPKVEVFVGYQWLNPGGNVPDQNSPPNAIQAEIDGRRVWFRCGLQLHQVSGVRRHLRRELEEWRRQ